jgi:hypothetical protein
MNLFLAVLKVKFAKAQTIFLAKTAGLGSRKRKNTFAKLFSTVKSGISSVGTLGLGVTWCYYPAQYGMVATIFWHSASQPHGAHNLELP